MATTNRKRAGAKGATKPAPNPDSQVPEQEAPAATGEPQATPVTDADAGDASAITASQEGEKINTPVQDEQATGATAADATVSGDGSGETLPPIDPEAGERTAEGVSDDAQGNDALDAVQDEIPALFIRTRKSILKRRRCGHVFTPEGHGIALSGLSAEQIAAFESDPALIVEKCSFAAKPDEDE